MTAVLLVRTMVDHQKINTRRRDIARSFFAAEAGIAQVLHWGNFPGDYDGGGATGYFYRDYSDPTWPFPNLTVQTPGAPSVTVDSSKLRTLTSSGGYEAAHVSSIVLESPAASDPVPCFFKARCTGSTQNGLERTILVYLEKSPVIINKLALGGALISITTAAQGGNAKVHWGEVWTRGDVNMPAKSQSNHIDKTSGSYDPFVSYRTEGTLVFDSTWKVGAGKDVYDPGARTSRGTHRPSGAYSDKPLSPGGQSALHTTRPIHSRRHVAIPRPAGGLQRLQGGGQTAWPLLRHRRRGQHLSGRDQGRRSPGGFQYGIRQFRPGQRPVRFALHRHH
jgi:hypothetical protein